MIQTILCGKYDIGSFSFDGELVITLREVRECGEQGVSKRDFSETPPAVKIFR